MKNTFHAVFTAALFALACTALHGQTSYSTTLTNAISPSQTANVCLASNTGVTLPSLMNGTAGSYFKIDSESVQVTAANAVPGCYKVRRGVFGTSPALHAAGAAVAVNPATSSTGDPSRPVTGLPTQGGTNANGGASSGGPVTSGAITTALGYTPASLDGTGKVPASQLPASGPAALPATVQYASKLAGASLDVDVTTGLKIGGGSATDNLAAANAFLATASPTNPIIFYIDGPMGIRGSLDVTATPYTTIDCISGGSVYSLSGSNGTTIKNGIQLPMDPNFTAPAKVGSVTIRGCDVYGNRGTYPNGNSSLASNGIIDAPSGNSLARERGGLGGYQIGALTGALNSSATSFTLSKTIPPALLTPFTLVIDSEIITVTAYSGATVTTSLRGASTAVGSAAFTAWAGGSAAASHLSGATAGTFTWYFGIDLANVANVLIDHVHVLDSPTYGIRLSNVGPAYITRSQVEFSAGTNQAPNTDGIHVNGPDNDVHISDTVLTRTGDDAMGFNFDEGSGGSGSRVQVNNVTCDRCAVGARVYGNIYRADQLSFQNFSGTFRDKYMILGNSVSTPIADAIGSILVSDATITAQNSGNTMQHAVEIGTNVGTAVFTNIRWVNPNAAAATWFSVSRAGVAISDLRLIESGIYRTTIGSGTPSFAVLNGATVKKFTTTGYSVSQQTGQSFSAVPYLTDSSGTITQWVNNNLDPNNIAALSSTPAMTGITEISGSGLTETGFYIPDAKVLKNGQYYVSKEQAVPVVKFGTASFATSAATSVSASTGAHNALLNAATSSTIQNRLQASAGNSFTEPGTGSFSVFGFINATTYPASTQFVASVTDIGNVGTISSYWLGYANSNNGFQFNTNDTTHAFLGANGVTTPTTNAWYFLVGTHNASTPSARVNTLYVNAVQDATASAGGNPTFNATLPLAIGGAYSSTATSSSQVLGRTAMVGKVGGVLTPTQITYLYNGGFGRSVAEINAYLTSPAVDYLYGMDAAGALGTDSSTHGTTLATVGTVSQGTGPH